MSNMEDLIKQYKHAFALLGPPDPVLQAQARYARDCEVIITEIATLAPNSLGFQQFFRVCLNVCSDYPDRSIDTLRALRWHLSTGQDTPLVRGLAERVRKAEEPAS